MSRDFKVEHHYAELDDVLLHYVTAGSGPPLVLIHGWPQTWFEWMRVMPALAERYTVIAPDMRGLGDSSRPLTGYDKQTVARDIWQVVNGKLGHDRFFLAGHDWGGPTAYALATQHPEAVRRLAIVDVVIPGDGGDFSQGGRRWHHQFHMTPDLPEALTQGREDVYLRWFYREFAYLPTAIGEEEIQEYLRTYRQPGAMRAGFSYYRALPQDPANNREISARMKLEMPPPTCAAWSCGNADTSSPKSSQKFWRGCFSTSLQRRPETPYHAAQWAAGCMLGPLLSLHSFLIFVAQHEV
jgi:pimeloyl-ACP methyl ester carboxylesterase